MNSPLRRASIWSLALIMGATVMVPSAMARTPRDLADLVGARASGGEAAMEDRGYELAATHGLTAYWWSDYTDLCVKVVTGDGHYQSISSTSVSHCGAVMPHGGSSNDAGAAIAGAIVGAAAGALLQGIVGGAQQGGSYDANYQQGYQDALNGTYNNAMAGAEGYGPGYGAGSRALQSGQADYLDCNGPDVSEANRYMCQ